MLLFSATYDDDDVMTFANKIIPNPFVIKLPRENLDNIGQYYIDCKDLDDKYNALVNIYGSISIGQCMIFCQVRTRLTQTVYVLTHFNSLDLDDDDDDYDDDDDDDDDYE